MGRKKGINALPLCSGCLHMPLARTLNFDWANLAPNYSSFISTPIIIPKEIPK